MLTDITICNQPFGVHRWLVATLDNTDQELPVDDNG